jgi:hypothetical protein
MDIKETNYFIATLSSLPISDDQVDHN